MTFTKDFYYEFSLHFCMVGDNNISVDSPHPTTSERSKQHYIFRILICLEILFPTILFGEDYPWLLHIGLILPLLFLGLFIHIPFMTQKMRKTSRFITLLISGIFILEILFFLFAIFILMFIGIRNSLMGINIVIFSLWCLLIPSFVCNFLDVKFDFSGDFTQKPIQKQKIKFSQSQTIKTVGIITGIINLPAFFILRLVYF